MQAFAVNLAIIDEARYRKLGIACGSMVRWRSEARKARASPPMSPLHSKAKGTKVTLGESRMGRYFKRFDLSADSAAFPR
jgi:hypothetical protein